MIRKIESICSNSYLIQTPDAIIVIDPGGIPEQAELLARVISEIREERKRPVFVILTHAHIDHFIGALQVPLFSDPTITVFIVQKTGASALTNGDRRLTQAEFFSRTFQPFSPGIRLFSGSEADNDCESGVTMCTNGAEVRSTGSDAGSSPASMKIGFGPGTTLEFFPAPGHSPDGICIRMGSLLFIGDVLFAANPGVAGNSGWDQKALIRSLDGIASLIAGGGIDLVCPGHGRVIGSADAARMLSAIRNDALALENIAELNRDRANETAEFAKDCMEQVDELFTIIAGRLSYVSYIMEELGEAGVAGETGGLISSDTIDDLIEAFRVYSVQHHKSGNVPIHLALKAGQIIGKLERAFRKDELAGIIDPSLVRRAGRLLSDYTTMLRGFNPPCERTACKVFPFTDAIIRELSAHQTPDDDILAASDDADAFTRMLLMRIGTRPLLEEVEVTCSWTDEHLTAEIDGDNYSDLLTYILEDLAGSGAGQISVQAQTDSGGVRILFTGSGCVARGDRTHEARGFLVRLCTRAGGSLTCCDEGNTRSLCYRSSCFSGKMLLKEGFEHLKAGEIPGNQVHSFFNTDFSGNKRTQCHTQFPSGKVKDLLRRSRGWSLSASSSISSSGFPISRLPSSPGRSSSLPMP